MEYEKAKVIIEHALKFIPKIKFKKEFVNRPFIDELDIECEDKITNVLYLIDELYTNELLLVSKNAIRIKIYTDWGDLIFNLIPNKIEEQ
jgi:hypothetical protein